MRVAGFVETAANAEIQIPEAGFIRGKGPISVTWLDLNRRLKKTGATGIFCESDYSALTILSLLQSVGIGVPGAVSVMGYGNLFFCLHTRPRLTSIEENLSGIGARAMNVLLKQIKSGKQVDPAENHLEYFAPRLARRGSTGTARQAGGK